MRVVAGAVPGEQAAAPEAPAAADTVWRVGVPRRPRVVAPPPPRRPPPPGLRVHPRLAPPPLGGLGDLGAGARTHCDAGWCERFGQRVVSSGGPPRDEERVVGLGRVRESPCWDAGWPEEEGSGSGRRLWVPEKGRPDPDPAPLDLDTSGNGPPNGCADFHAHPRHFGDAEGPSSRSAATFGVRRVKRTRDGAQTFRRTAGACVTGRTTGRQETASCPP